MLMVGNDQSREATRQRQIVDFFDGEYGWWGDVYDESLPKGFFSYEMIRRKQLLLELLDRYAGRKKGARILECGCGPGGILRDVDRRRRRLVGVDINFRYLEEAKREVGPHVEWAQADVENLPFRSGIFDLVYCVGVLSYLEEDDKAIGEMCRVIKPGGIVVISLPNFFMLNKFLDPYYFTAWWMIAIGKKIKRRFSNSESGTGRYESNMIRRYHLKYLKNMYKSYNLQEMETRSVSYGPLTIWRKEIFDSRKSIKISEKLQEMSRKFELLKYGSNHWVTCLKKQVS